MSTPGPGMPTTPVRPRAGEARSSSLGQLAPYAPGDVRSARASWVAHADHDRLLAEVALLARHDIEVLDAALREADVAPIADGLLACSGQWSAGQRGHVSMWGYLYEPVERAKDTCDAMLDRAAKLGLAGASDAAVAEIVAMFRAIATDTSAGVVAEVLRSLLRHPESIIGAALAAACAAAATMAPNAVVDGVLCGPWGRTGVRPAR